jgi:hypothetical protein
VFAQQSNRLLPLQLTDNDEQTLNGVKCARTCYSMISAVANVVLNRPQPSGEKFQTDAQM